MNPYSQWKRTWNPTGKGIWCHNGSGAPLTSETHFSKSQSLSADFSLPAVDDEALQVEFLKDDNFRRWACEEEGTFEQQDAEVAMMKMRMVQGMSAFPYASPACVLTPAPQAAPKQHASLCRGRVTACGPMTQAPETLLCDLHIYVTLQQDC